MQIPSPARLTSCFKVFEPQPTEDGIRSGSPTIKGLRDKSSSFIPALPTRAYNRPVPLRIHRKAFWRGGTGAGVGGEAQNLIARVRGKWFSSGDVGRTGSSRTDFPFVAHHEASGAPVRHGRMTGKRHAASGIFKNSGRAAQVEDRAPGSRDPDGSPVACRNAGLRMAGPACREPKPPPHRPRHRRRTEVADINRRTRGAERCHLYYHLRGSFQRPVRTCSNPDWSSKSGSAGMRFNRLRSRINTLFTR